MNHNTMEEVLLSHGCQIFRSVKQVARVSAEVEDLRHYLNQQSILVDTLMAVIMGTYESDKQGDMPK